MAEFLTLQDAADLLDVHYATVYRYIRSGLLPAERHGRSWLLDPDDVERLRSERASAPSVGVLAADRSRMEADWPRRLESRLVVGDRRGALRVLEGALAAGYAPSELYVHVVAGAMTAIGVRWESGEIDVAVEHRASVIVIQSLAVLAARFHRHGESRGVVIIGAAPGERHSLPARLVADVLRIASFDVQDLGADVPARSFAVAATGVPDLVAVGISVTMGDNERAVREATSAVRSARRVPILVGGAAIADGDVAASVGADGWAPDALGAVDLLEALVPT